MASTLCTMYYLPSSSSFLKPHKIQLNSKFSQMGMSHFSTWSGLKHVGISVSAKPFKVGSKGKCRGKVVYASLFGVGAPEALVIGVVALLVFGPKGLAEVARNLGKTLRSFQPTIKELQEVSREFKSTLEREIGLDDDPRTMRNIYDSNGVNSTSNSTISSVEDSVDLPVSDPNGSPPSKAYTSEEYLKITEEQLKASAAAEQVTLSPPESLVEPESPPEGQQDIESSSSERQSALESQPQASQQDIMSTPPDSQLEPSNVPEGTVQETTTSAPLAQNSESQS